MQRTDAKNRCNYGYSCYGLHTTLCKFVTLFSRKMVKNNQRNQVTEVNEKKDLLIVPYWVAWVGICLVLSIKKAPFGAAGRT